MDLIILVIVCVILSLRVKDADTVITSKVEKPLVRETKLNPDFYDDPNAFRRLVDELDF